MALQLFHLAATSAGETANNYFYKKNAKITVSTAAGFSIKKSIWLKGNGSAVGTGAFATATNGYYNLFVNGVLQQSALFGVNSARVVLNKISVKYTIAASSPLTLTVNAFTPSSVLIP